MTCADKAANQSNGKACDHMGRAPLKKNRPTQKCGYAEEIDGGAAFCKHENSGDGQEKDSQNCGQYADRRDVSLVCKDEGGGHCES